MTAALVDVTVTWITAQVQDIVPVTLPVGATLGEAIAASGLAAAHGIDASQLSIAVAGQRRRPDDRVNAGDRIDLLRPLTADAKAARRDRAARSRREKPSPAGR